MADKKSLFAGRTGNKTAKLSSAPKKRSGNLMPAASGSGEKKAPPSFGKSGFGKGVAATQQRRDVQVKEAEDYLKQANKMLTKTLTRWNPDFFSAAPLFEKAGACYRAAGEDGKATAMFMQAGDCQCHDSVMAHASAAKDFREAALITERQGRREEAAAFYMRCAEAWVNADEPGRAAEYFGRSAKLVKDSDEDAAAERYIAASKVMVPNGSDSRSNFTRVVGGVEVLVQAIIFLASTNRLEQSMEVVSRYVIILEAEGMEHSLGRMYLTYCILALALGDYVRADMAFRNVHLQSTAYLRSEECRVEEELLIAFKDSRPDLLMEAQKDRTLHRLETAIVRIAKSLRVPGDEDDEDEDIIPARETPSGTIGAAQARAQALKEKYGGGGATPAAARTAASPPFGGGGGGGSGGASSVPPVPPPRPAVASPSSGAPAPPNAEGTSEQALRTESDGTGKASPQASDEDSARGALFGEGSRKAKPSPPTASSAADTAAASSPVAAAAAAAGSARPSGAPEACPIIPETSADGPGDAEVDLGLGDLEASLGTGGGGGDDDLEAMIEAARREAEGLALGGEGGGAAEDSDEEEEDDIDLT
ncbi:unnamed protein product [Ectocarpus sp. 12 AP-2014]